MQNIHLKKAYIGEDGILKVQMPTTVKNSQLEVFVIFKPATEEKIPRHQGWPPDFFDRTWGSCADDPILIDEDGISAELDDKLEGVFDPE